MSAVTVVKNGFPKLAVELNVKAKAVVDNSANRIASDAARRAPVLTGELRGSVHASGGSITASAPYAGYVEHGTRFMAAEPFFQPAIDAEAPKFEAEMAAILKSA